MEFLVTLVNSLKTLTNVTKYFIIDVTKVLDTPLNFDVKVSGTTKDGTFKPWK